MRSVMFDGMKAARRFGELTGTRASDRPSEYALRRSRHRAHRPGRRCSASAFPAAGRRLPILISTCSPKSCRDGLERGLHRAAYPDFSSTEGDIMPSAWSASPARAEPWSAPSSAAPPHLRRRACAVASSAIGPQASYPPHTSRTPFSPGAARRGHGAGQVIDRPLSPP